MGDGAWPIGRLFVGSGLGHPGIVNELDPRPTLRPIVLAEEGEPSPSGSGGNPFIACWGDHGGRCRLLDGQRPGRSETHGLVVELDYDDPSHRMLLRWLRNLAASGGPVTAIPRLAPVPESGPLEKETSK